MEGALGPASVVGTEAEEVDLAVAVFGFDPGGGAFNGFGMLNVSRDEDVARGIIEVCCDRTDSLVR